MTAAAYFKERNMSKIRIQRWCGALALGAGSLMAFGAHAAGTGSGQSQYQMDVQRCNSGDTSQDRATCLREAGAARQESQRNRLDDKQEGRYQDNAMMRCKNLPASQQQDCITQMTSGNTTTRGSVGGGGVLRETVIQVPAGTPGSTPGTPMPGGQMPSGQMPSGQMPGAAPGGLQPPPAGTVAPPPVMR
ncbi:hypothetical protein [Bordetella bronchiseptica]|uniref:Exported protein n=1 Tax=Bordetella bronchiseptica (strain ATCC BAA-588 / NCTC 13252 / RB50) TaxID=257310 RepID=A0A0H3LUF6_BORBR|nr:hypothetical protein [Bordetella bronchiseptica]AUV49917.1 hypothetical protein AL472_16720 [Bordetella bronchiseptica]AWP79748.1 hypothetical protein B7P04_10835 [Bordetella bronchiseptica]AWP84561.1 hypothetical protein B7P00_10875 [Bordetella bronchiseptica]KCV50225.1 hypothetical protein L491_3103 [Bordetella bronchiseptica 3E44]KCV63787.1 hypothetical protein AZ14_3170 [Bordetella bronchiseptica 980]